MGSETTRYILHPNKNNDINSVWQHFYISSDKQSAKCKFCPNKIIATKGGSTKGLHKHMAVHKKAKSGGRQAENVSIDVEENFVEATPSTSTFSGVKRKVSDYFLVDRTREDSSLEAVLARMTALDGLPFRVFVVSKDLRLALEARGFVNLPTSSTTVKDKVINYCDKIFDNFATVLKTMQQRGQRFSLTFDEWTSAANKRYLNVNIHGSEQQRVKIWNVGLLRAKGSISADKCAKLVQEKLDRFSLSLDDVVCVTTDGASVMVKLGKQIKALQQLCFAHAIHLAVIDTVYSNTDIGEAMEESQSKSDEDCIGTDCDEDEDESNVDDEGGLQLLIGVGEDEEELSLSLSEKCNINALVTKVRKIVKLFRRSPLKNTVLQNYVKVKHNKELSLILDCRTRWNSLIQMLERFVFLKDCIQKAMIDLALPVTISDSDFKALEGIVNSMEPVRLTVLALCRRDSNLYTADTTFRFLFDEMSKIKTSFSRDLLAALQYRLGKRRTAASSVLSYLCNPTKYTENEDHLSCLNTRETTTRDIAKFVENIVERLSRTPVIDINTIESNSDEEIPLAVVRDKEQNQNSLEVKLNMAIENAMTASTSSAAAHSAAKSLATIIKKEMTLFENGGSRGKNLHLCYEYLITIPPTSVESERAFSVAGAFFTKIRSKLGDDSLNALVALKSYFAS